MAVVVASPSLGSAQPDDELWTRAFAFELQTAAVGPVGGGGGTVEVTPHRNVSLVAGAGAALPGWRVGVGIRPQWPFARRAAVGFETFYSFGPHEDPILRWGKMAPFARWEHAHWIRHGLSLEIRSLRGFRFRPFFGAAFLVGYRNESCLRGDCSTVEPRRVFPYLGFAMGWALPLLR